MRSHFQFPSRLLATITATLVLALFATQQSAQAQLIAADGYVTDGGVVEYEEGFSNSFNGQSSNSSFGFIDPWGGSSSGNTHPDTVTLQNPAIDYESGGKGKFTPNASFSDFERRYEHTLDSYAPPANDVFFMSHLVNTGGEISGGATEGYAMVGFGSFADKTRLEGTQDFLLGAFLGFAPDGAGNVDLVIRSRTAPNGPGAVTDEILRDASAGEQVDNTTFHVVMKLTYTGGDRIDWWLNPTNFNSEAAMTSSALDSGSIPGFQLTNASDMTRLTVNTFGYDRSFFWDESRLAYDLQSVAGVPEPTTFSLAMLAWGVIVRRRR